MVDVAIEPVEASVAKMQKDLADVQRLMGRTAPQAVTWAAQLFARSAAAVAKPGATRRDVRSDPSKPGVWWMTVWSQDPHKATEVRIAGGENDPARKIEQRGLSRRVWTSLAGMASAFKPAGSSGRTATTRSVFDSMPATARGRTRRRRLHAAYSMFFDANIAESKITNELSYQREAYPALEATAMYNAERALRWRLDQALGIVK